MYIKIFKLSGEFKIEVCFHWFSDGGILNLNIHEASDHLNSTRGLKPGLNFVGWRGLELGQGSSCRAEPHFLSAPTLHHSKCWGLAVILTDLHFYTFLWSSPKCLKCRHGFFVSPDLAEIGWLLARPLLRRNILKYFKIKSRIRPHYMCSLCDAK